MIRNLKNETWKEIVFDENISEKEKFKISNHGRVINCKGEKEYLKRPSYINGYENVQVRQKSGKITSRYVHKLIAEHFLEKKESEIFVIHLDYDKTNNHIDNLKWATKKEKEEHQFSNPEFKNAKRRTYSKLTENQVRLIKRKINDPKRKTRMKMIAKQFGISEMQLYRIKSGENWASIPEN